MMSDRHSHLVRGVTEEESMLSTREVIVGSRVESDGYYATIRYIGNVASTNGLWYGVEWDDPTRGKHDGSLEDVRYFQTRSDRAGSFLRPKKCRAGVGFMRAVLERYGRGGGDEADMYVAGGNKQTAVVLIGADKVNELTSQLARLENLCLRENLINGPDSNSSIISPERGGLSLPRVKQLDLSLNLLSTWVDVASIVTGMPQLEELNVSANRMALPPDTGSDCGLVTDASIFSRVRVLYVNRMHYTWPDLRRVVGLFSALEWLHACYNFVAHIRPTVPAFHSDRLTLLNLEKNALSGWKDVLALDSMMPNLETLILNATGLTDVYFPDGDSPSKPTNHLSRLKSLSLDDNLIAGWSPINALYRLRALSALRFARNPLTKEVGTSATHHTIIAKVGGIRRLNGTVIDSTERKGAEWDYVKKHGRVWVAARGVGENNSALTGRNKCAGGEGSGEGMGRMKGGKALEEFRNEHPRFEELVGRYGEPEESETKEEVSSALKNTLVTVNIDCPGAMPPCAPCTRKLPATMTIQKLLILVQRLFNIRTDSRSIRLTYTSHKLQEHSPEIQLDNDLKEIGFYSIEDQDHIHVYW